MYSRTCALHGCHDARVRATLVRVRCMRTLRIRSRSGSVPLPLETDPRPAPAPAGPRDLDQRLHQARLRAPPPPRVG